MNTSRGKPQIPLRIRPREAMKTANRPTTRRELRTDKTKKASKRSLQTTSRLSSEVPGEPQTLYLLLSHFIYIADNQTLFYL